MIVEINQKMLSIFETNFSTNTTHKNLMTNMQMLTISNLFFPEELSLPII